MLPIIFLKIKRHYGSEIKGEAPKVSKLTLKIYGALRIEKEARKSEQSVHIFVPFLIKHSVITESSESCREVNQ